jgi:uncharacterized membrane protein YqjE
VLKALYRRVSLWSPWGIFWVGLVVRVAAILIGRTYRLPVVMDHFEYGWEVGRIARSVVEGHGYGNPFNGVSGPTAWLPPLYPLLVAGAFKVFGVYSRGAAIAILICNSVFSAGIVPGVYEIAERCFDAKGIARRGAKVAAPVALWAAWLWAVYPAALQYAVRWIWEMSLSTFLFTWAIVLALRLRGVGEGAEDGEQRLGLWAGFGGIWGLVALSNASLLLCLPAMVVWIVWPELRAVRLTWRTLAGACVMAVVFCGALTPWVIRNELVLHAFVPTRDNLGVEMYESTLESHEALPWGTAMPLWAGDPEFQRYVRMGEVRYAKVRGEEAKARLRARPGLFLRFTRDRFLYFWDGTPHPVGNHPVGEYFRELSYAFLSVCGLLGLGLMLRRRVAGAGLFGLVFLLVPLPYYLVTVQPRFRHPLEPLIAVLAVYLFRSTEVSEGMQVVHG